MTEQEAVELIHQRAWVGQKPGLARMRRLLGRLGDPQKELRFVHIAGSNGKGSTAAMLASVLTAAGLTAGLYTSPHLWQFHERFQVDGVPVSGESLVKFTAQVLDAAEDETEFELMTAIAMLHFRRMRCDIVVLETGLGGRLDSTNVIDVPEVAVITHIGLEHTEQLGNTLAGIAAEKAGIIKEGGSVVLYDQRQEVLDVVERVCRIQNAALAVTDTPEALDVGLEGQTFTYRGNGPYRISLLGEHQLRNAAVVLETVGALRELRWKIPEDAVVQGLAQARWPARLELLRRHPDVILDGGHNPQCMEALAQSLKKLYPERKVIFLTGVLADKDYRTMMGELLPLAKEFFTVTPDSPRAMSAKELAEYLEGQGVMAVSCGTVQEGIERALESAGAEDVVCVCGSLYMVGEARHLLT